MALTARQILTPVVGEDALRLAESHAYDYKAGGSAWATKIQGGIQGNLTGFEARCALGLILAGMPEASTRLYIHYPFASDFLRYLDGTAGPIAYPVLQAIQQRNDAGEFQEPGSLTAFLDRPFVPEEEE